MGVLGQCEEGLRKSGGGRGGSKSPEDKVGWTYITSNNRCVFYPIGQDVNVTGGSISNTICLVYTEVIHFRRETMCGNKHSFGLFIILSYFIFEGFSFKFKPHLIKSFCLIFLPMLKYFYISATFFLSAHP